VLAAGFEGQGALARSLPFFAGMRQTKKAEPRAVRLFVNLVGCGLKTLPSLAASYGLLPSTTWFYR
jgi:hypothetical protein